MKTKRVKLENLVPDNLNANRGTARGAGMVEHSIRNYGAGRSILVDAQNRIIAGNKTHAASLEAGLQDAVVVETDGTQLVVVRRSDVSLDSPEGRALAIADNRAAEVGLDWDLDALAEISEELDLSQFWFEGEIDIPDLSLDGPGAEDGLTDPDEVPDAQEVTVSRTGDLWILGSHRVLCGDSTSAEDVSRLMDGDQADLWLTDPPYNVAYVGKTKDAKTIANDSMDDEAFRNFLRSAYEVAFNNMSPGAAFYIWHADLEGYNFRGAVQDCGEVVRQCLVWSKQTLVMGRQDYHWKHEPCLYGWKSGAAHGWYSDRKQTTVLEFDRPSRSAEHPTMKPVDLFSYQIGNSTAPKGLVLDTFLGSGTSVIAAEEMGRRCYGMELDPVYVDVIVRRWQDYTGKSATLGDGRTFDEVEGLRMGGKKAELESADK